MDKAKRGKGQQELYFQMNIAIAGLVQSGKIRGKKKILRKIREIQEIFSMVGKTYGY